MSKILYRENHAEVDAIDTGLGNKWRWDWLVVVSVDMNKCERITWKSDDPLNICLKDGIRKSMNLERPYVYCVRSLIMC